MKNLFYLIACSTILLSCSKKLQPTVETIYKDSIVEKKVVTVKDTTIYLKGDTVTIHDSIPCAIDYKKTDSSGKTKLTLTISKGKLTAKCENDSLLARIHWLENEYYKERFTSKEKKITKYIEVPKPVKYTPPWHWWLHLFSFLFVCWHFRKPILSTLKHLITKW